MKIFIHLTLSILMTACSYVQPPSPALTEPEHDSTEKVILERLSFANLQREIFMKRCQTCHQKKGEFTFENYERVARNLDEIQNRVLFMGDMPPNKPLSDDESKLLDDWIKAGAPR